LLVAVVVDLMLVVLVLDLEVLVEVEADLLEVQEVMQQDMVLEVEVVTLEEMVLKALLLLNLLQAVIRIIQELHLLC
tara:strand:+ start:269 stop:499 length:231 start_codon:yes stop_codon:yes gene_type:complete